MERNLNWLLVMSIRYALARDNGMALSNFKMVVFDTLELMKDLSYKEYTIEKLINEIMTELEWGDKKDKNEWLLLVEKLKGVRNNETNQH